MLARLMFKILSWLSLFAVSSAVHLTDHVFLHLVTDQEIALENILLGVLFM